MVHSSSIPIDVLVSSRVHQLNNCDELACFRKLWEGVYDCWQQHPAIMDDISKFPKTAEAQQTLVGAFGYSFQLLFSGDTLVWYYYIKPK